MLCQRTHNGANRVLLPQRDSGFEDGVHFLQIPVKFDESPTEKPNNSCMQMGNGFDLTLPDRQDAPAAPSQRAKISRISSSCFGKFCSPPCGARLRHGATLASMLMPKTAANIDDLAAAGEHKVGATGQCPDMEAIAIAKAVNETSDGQFRLRVLAPHQRHAATAFFGAKEVHALPAGGVRYRLLLSFLPCRASATTGVLQVFPV